MTTFETSSFEAQRASPGAAEAARAAQVIRDRALALTGRALETPLCGIVLGSGLGGLANQIENATRIPFADIPGFPAATVAGHAGQLIVGTLSGRPVVALAGRIHLYEGHAAALAGFPVRLLHALLIQVQRLLFLAQEVEVVRQAEADIRVVRVGRVGEGTSGGEKGG